ncbi:MFS transporter [Amycolatopsis taiwanensis]|uniref:MFS transporter n=1 Tax=Amycolatopsis taiwanensis TaxID=342230 RepID=A0A9W6RA50_9PSEU|nr:MFS transporter [Amycolatopsis taiwanensis]GLY71025.1 MFS transporter [Amycolatopsis taiwanensis]
MPAQTIPRTSAERPKLALAVVLVAVFMDMVDSTIVNVALPQVQRSLDAGDAEAQWILAGYSLTFALALITGGRIGDIFGRKRVFLTGVAGFTIASTLCGAAINPEILIGARFAQGISAALMVPQVMSIIVIMFGQRERYKALAVYGAVLSLGNVSGPLLGGLLTEYNVFGLHWRAIFYVNVPIGVLTFTGAALFMPESRSDRPLRVDLVGIGLISLVSFALMYPLIQGREAGWPVWMIIMLVAAIPLLVLFHYSQRYRDRRDGSALVPPELLRHRSFVIGLVILLTLYTGLASLFLVLSYDFQQGMGWSPIKTALSWLGWPIGITATSGFAQRFGATHGRRLIQIGLVTMSAGILLLIGLMTGYGPAVAWWQVATPTLVMGLGMGLCVSILTNVVLADVPEHSAGAGSGVTNAILQLGAATGIAVVGLIFFGLASAGPATAENLTSAASTTLWYHAAAFIMSAALAPLLRPARRPAPVPAP